MLLRIGSGKDDAPKQDVSIKLKTDATCNDLYVACIQAYTAWTRALLAPNEVVLVFYDSFDVFIPPSRGLFKREADFRNLFFVTVATLISERDAQIILLHVSNTPGTTVTCYDNLGKESFTMKKQAEDLVVDGSTISDIAFDWNKHEARKEMYVSKLLSRSPQCAFLQVGPSKEYFVIDGGLYDFLDAIVKHAAGGGPSEPSSAASPDASKHARGAAPETTPLLLDPRLARVAFGDPARIGSFVTGAVAHFLAPIRLLAKLMYVRNRALEARDGSVEITRVHFPYPNHA